MSCVAACPVEHGLQFAAAPRRTAEVARRWRGRVAGPAFTATTIAFVLLGAIGAAKASGHWRTPVLHRVYVELVTHADAWSH